MDISHTSFILRALYNISMSLHFANLKFIIKFVLYTINILFLCRIDIHRLIDLVKALYRISSKIKPILLHFIKTVRYLYFVLILLLK